MIPAGYFERPTLAELSKRCSAKWTTYGPDVLPAFIAELDVELADPIRTALQGAIALGDSGYSAPAPLTRAFAGFAQRRYGWTIDPRLIITVPDVTVGIVEVLRALTGADEGVVINTPVYAPFYSAISEAGRRRIESPLLRNSDLTYDLDLEALEAAFAAGARAFVLCNPHNPVGRVFAPRTLERVADLAARYNVLVIADEVHAPLVLPGASHTPFAALAPAHGLSALTLTSASKAWNLAGLKCAILIASDDAMRQRLNALPKEVRYRTGHLGAIASTAAFSDGVAWLDALCEHLDRNRHALRDLLAIHLPLVRYKMPEAGYLAWLDCSALDLGDDPMATFLARGRVALTAGTVFGNGGAGFVRLNFGTTTAILTEIVQRMAGALCGTSQT